MSRAVFLRSESEQRNLEYDYLALSYQLSGLVEDRLRESKMVDQLQELALQIEEFLRSSPLAAERKTVALNLEQVIKESEACLCLYRSTSNYPDRLFQLHLELAGVGGLLGYHRCR